MIKTKATIAKRIAANTLDITKIDFTAPEMRNPEIIVKLLEYDPGFMQEVSEGKREKCKKIISHMSKGQIMRAVKLNSSVLAYADKYQDDFDVVLTAVTADSDAFCWASGRLKNNKTIVMTAVKQNGTVVWYTSKELCDDEDVIMAALQACQKPQTTVLPFASERLQKDPYIRYLAAGLTEEDLAYIAEKYKNSAKKERADRDKATA